MKIIHVLMAFESKNEADNYIKQLLKSGMNVECQVVSNEQELIITLEERCWDIIISGSCFVGQTVIDGLKVRNQLGISIPFVIISEQLSEEELDLAYGNGLTAFVDREKITELVSLIHRLVI